LNFSQQEPGGTDEEILNGIRYVRPGNDFQTNITLFRKIDVNGANEHPLYSYLKVSYMLFVIITTCDVVIPGGADLDYLFPVFYLFKKK
jgi:glutathione peroxidase-family protein